MAEWKEKKYRSLTWRGKQGFPLPRYPELSISLAVIPGKRKKRCFKQLKNVVFRPNVNAIGLRTRRSHSVGVIVPDITNEFFAKIVRTLDVFFVKYNYSVLICDSNEDPELEERHIQDMFDKNVDGFIYVSGMEAISPLVKTEGAGGLY